MRGIIFLEVITEKNIIIHLQAEEVVLTWRKEREKP